MRNRRSYAWVLAGVACSLAVQLAPKAAAQGGWRGPLGVRAGAHPTSTDTKAKALTPAQVDRVQRRQRGLLGKRRSDGAAAAAAAPEAEVPSAARSAQVTAQGRCDESMVLVASVAQAPAAEHSMAAIRVGGGVHMLKPGQHFGDYALAAVETNYVVLRHRAGGTCWVGFASARSASASAEPGQQAQQPTTQIHCSPGGTCSVPRGFVGEVTINPGAVRGTIIRAEMRDNQPYGIQMAKLMEDSPFLAIGLQEGDVVRKVDGRDVPSYPEFMEALAAGKDARSVTLSYERQGQQRQLVVLAQ